MNLFISILIAFTTSSVSTDLTEITVADKIVGSWIYDQEIYHEIEYVKNKKLKKKHSGFTF